MKRIIIISIIAIIAGVGIYFIIPMVATTTPVEFGGIEINVGPGCKSISSNICAELDDEYGDLGMTDPCLYEGTQQCKKVWGKCKLVLSEEAQKCWDKKYKK